MEIEDFISWASLKYSEVNWEVEVKSKHWLKFVSTLFPEFEREREFHFINAPILKLFNNFTYLE